jgi:hypothetical protein
MLWPVSRLLRSRSKPDGFILPCQPALADRPPSGPGWLHEIKFDGCRVIARKDGEQVRLWARTKSDYSNAFTRIRASRTQEKIRPDQPVPHQSKHPPRKLGHLADDTRSEPFAIAT